MTNPPAAADRRATAKPVEGPMATPTTAANRTPRETARAARDRWNQKADSAWRERFLRAALAWASMTRSR
jgi:hypothetical protein